MIKKRLASMLASLLSATVLLSSLPAVSAQEAVDQSGRTDGKYELILDDYETYSSDVDLQKTYSRNANGGPNTVGLTDSLAQENSGQAMQVTYTLNSAGYSGVYRAVNGYWPGAEAVSLWFQGDGKGQDILLQLSDGASYEAHLNTVAGFDAQSTQPQFLEIPIEKFTPKSGSGTINLKGINSFALYVNAVDGAQFTDSVLKLDEIKVIFPEAPVLPSITFNETELNATGNDNLITTLRRHLTVSGGGELVQVQYETDGGGILDQTDDLVPKGIFRQEGTVQVTIQKAKVYIEDTAFVLDVNQTVTIHVSDLAEPVDVVDYLKDLTGKGLITGMHFDGNYNDADSIHERIANEFGAYPAFYSADFLTGGTVAQRQNMIDEVIRQWNNGAVVQIMFHISPPQYTVEQEKNGTWGGDGWNERKNQPNHIYSFLYNSDWEELMTDGTELNTNWKKRMDEYASYLQQLEDAGVTVLLRPFHEMNQHVFWWGGRPGLEGTAGLYRMFHDYMEQEKDLSNIIWVWDVQDMPPDYGNAKDAKFAPYRDSSVDQSTVIADYDAQDIDSFSPGADYYDILAMDYYDQGLNEPGDTLDHNHVYTQEWYDKVKAVAQRDGKPMIIGETWAMISPETWQAQPDWTMCMPWGNRTWTHNATGAQGMKEHYQRFFNIEDTPTFASRHDVYKLVVDDYASYADDTALRDAYKANANGDSNSVSVVDSPFAEGGKALAFTYSLASSGYSGVARAISQNWASAQTLNLWFQGDGKGQDILLQLGDGDLYSGTDYTFECHLNDLPGFDKTSTEPQYLEIPISAFKVKSGNRTIDLTNMQSFALYVNAVDGAKVENSALILGHVEVVLAEDPNKPTPSEPANIDDFEGYENDAALIEAYLRDQTGGANTVKLQASPFEVGGKNAMSMAYNTAGPGYTGAVKAINEDWSGVKSIKLDYKGSGLSGQSILLRLESGEKGNWVQVDLLDLRNFDPYSTEIQNLDIAMEAFLPMTEGAKLDASHILSFGVYVKQLGGESRKGTLLFDNISWSKVPPVAVPPSYEVKLTNAKWNAAGGDTLMSLLRKNTRVHPLEEGLPADGKAPYILQVRYDSDNSQILKNDGLFSSKGVFRSTGDLKVDIQEVTVYADGKQHDIPVNKTVNIHVSDLDQPIDVLDYFKQLKGQGTLSAMHNKEPNAKPRTSTDRIMEMTGVTPAVWSGDFLFMKDDVANRQKMIDEAIRQWNDGALVNIMFHVPSPLRTVDQEKEGAQWSSSDPEKNAVQCNLTDEEWESLLTDGGALNLNWKKRLDEYATYLQQLKDAGVVPMVRPFHEMNQHVFWWAGVPQNTAALYRLTKDYLVNEKGLDNMIWLWNMQDIDGRMNWEDYNPGDDYWDVLTLDVYAGGYSDKYYEQMKKFAGDKPMAIGECWKLIQPDQLAKYTDYVFAMPWSDDTWNQNSDENIRNFYDNTMGLLDTPAFASRSVPKGPVEIDNTEIQVSGSANMINALNDNATVEGEGWISAVRYESSNPAVLPSSDEFVPKASFIDNGTTQVTVKQVKAYIDGKNQIIDLNTTVSVTVKNLAEPVDVLDYLKQITGKNMVTALHNQEPNADPDKQTSRLFEEIGIMPAMWSGDFLYSKGDVANRQTMIDECIKQWNNGAIVQLMLHVAPPTMTVEEEKNGCKWDDRTSGEQKGVQCYLSDAQWKDLLTDGGALNANWKLRLDEYASYLQQLEDAGVTVLFRPFHEMNQHVFWWGGKLGEYGTTALYRMTREYLENDKGLSNLIWVWDMQDLPADYAVEGSTHQPLPDSIAPYDATDLQLFNPGNDYWDIFALDFYDAAGFTQFWYDQACEIVEKAGGKPMIIGETGTLISNQQWEEQSNWSLCMPWAGQVFSNNTIEARREYYGTHLSIEDTPRFLSRQDAKEANKFSLKIAISIASKAQAGVEYENAVQWAKDQLDQALLEANTLLENAKATQTQVDEMVIRLMNAVWNLGFISGDLAELKAYIELAEAMDMNQYQSEGKQAFLDALAAAKEVAAKENVMQQEIDDALKALQQAVANLRSVVDKSELKKAIDLARELDLSLYVDKGKTELRLALTAAQGVYDDLDASKELVDAATEKLLLCLGDLRFLADKDHLADLIAQAETALTDNEYTEESLQVVREVLQQALAVMNNQQLSTDEQKTVDDMANALERALRGLEKKSGGGQPGDTPSSDANGNPPASTGDNGLNGIIWVAAAWAVLSILTLKLRKKVRSRIH